jgi:hypothetical protein
MEIIVGALSLAPPQSQSSEAKIAAQRPQAFFVYFSPIRIQKGGMSCVVIRIGPTRSSHPPFMGLNKKAPIDIGAGTY